MRYSVIKDVSDFNKLIKRRLAGATVIRRIAGALVFTVSYE